MLRAFLYPLLLLVAMGNMAMESEAMALDEDSAEKVMRVHRVLLETSMEPATLDECKRTIPNRPRPHQVVSFQNGSATPWHHRICYYLQAKG